MATGTAPDIKINARLTGFEQIDARLAEINRKFQNVSKQINANSAGGNKLAAGFTSANHAISNTGSIASRSFGAIKVSVSTIVTLLVKTGSLLVDFAKKAATASAAAGVIGAGAYAAMKTFATTVGTTIGSLDSLAKASGIPTDRFSRLASAMRTTGGTVEDLSGGLQALAGLIIDAGKDPNGGSNDKFKQLGINVRDAKGDLKSTSQILDEVADGLKNVQSDTLRSSAAMELFGGAAFKLLPIMKDGSEGLHEFEKRADRFGTVVTAAQSQAMEKLIVKGQSVTEAITGVSYKIVEAIMPALNASSEQTADLIAKNSDKIAAFAGNALLTIKRLGDDVSAAFQGNAADIQNKWIKKLVPAITLVKNVAIDLVHILEGGPATRARWLNDIGRALVSAKNAALAFGTAIVNAAGFATSDLPTISQLAKGVSTAIESLKQGLSGNDAALSDMPWAAKIGDVLRSLGTAFGAVVGVIIQNRELITTALAAIAKGFADLVVAVSDLLNGNKISKDNPFAFLQPVGDFVKAHISDIISVFVGLPGQIGDAFKAFAGIGEYAFGILDSIAKLLGLDGPIQLGLIALGLHFSGAGKIIASLVAILVTFISLFNGVFTMVRNVSGLITGLLWPALAGLTTLIVGATAPVWVFATAATAIGVAIAGLAYAIYKYWDEIVATAKFAGNLLASAIEGIISIILHPIDTFVSAFDVVKSTLKSFGQWLGILNKDIASPLDTAATAVKDTTDKAVDSAKDKLDDLRDHSKQTSAEIIKLNTDTTITGPKASYAGMTSAADAAQKSVEATKKAIGDATTAATDGAETIADTYHTVVDPFIYHPALATWAVSNMAQYGIEKTSQAVSDQVDTAKDAVSDLLDGQSAGLKTVSSALGSVKDTASSAINSVKSSFNGLVSYFSGIATNITLSFESLWEYLLKSSDVAQQAVLDNFESLLEPLGKLASTIGDIFDQMWSRVGSATDAAIYALQKKIAIFYLEGFQGLVSSLIMPSFFDLFIDAWEDAFKTVWQYIEAGATATFSKVASIWQGLKNVLGFGDQDSTDQSSTSSSGGSLPGFSTGGRVTGPGTGTSDSIFARLSNGEGVLTSNAMSHYGSGIVDTLNNLLLPKSALDGRTASVPTRSGGLDLGKVALSLNGRNVNGTIYGDADALRSIKRDFRKTAMSSRGPAPRWRGY